MSDHETVDARIRAQKAEVLNRVRDMLLEGGFDAAVVIGSWQTEDGQTTACAQRGIGNWYARNGMLRHVLTKAEENARLEEKELSEDADD